MYIYIYRYVYLYIHIFVVVFFYFSSSQQDRSSKHGRHIAYLHIKRHPADSVLYNYGSESTGGRKPTINIARLYEN